MHTRPGTSRGPFTLEPRLFTARSGALKPPSVLVSVLETLVWCRL